ncbi:hypothetical protein [Jiella pacifica]|uniref:Uncharacterized protein n=1 Tax=Jiella pacifica TaxID=2696469 RepID=A0A6N9TB91_9HYPH|nr:hypothetical protein [Jiella pacifica]NDW06148.1 hypothetical protein [Jiella pacifica]
MKRIVATLLLVLAMPASALADHPCADDARRRAADLLAFHFEQHLPAPIDLESDVSELPPVRAPVGAAFDVLEIWGHIYRADYRMRFLYAQIPGTCALMGQEILENSDPS